MVITMEIGTAFFSIVSLKFELNFEFFLLSFVFFLKCPFLLQNTFWRFKYETIVFFDWTIFSSDSKTDQEMYFFRRRSTQCSGMCWWMCQIAKYFRTLKHRQRIRSGNTRQYQFAVLEALILLHIRFKTEEQRLSNLLFFSFFF